ncbi:hypothetical protein C8N24_3844 [Solirubrobacter pauli]|uniref:Uncharacterized protein n=1 Tax=Solirubrobacter pauli TaxID=166793 RepID=A0A660LFT0_9ACTN|nr:hypothetical protein C8N24_3844 [Solirubrobacter pauli]
MDPNQATIGNANSIRSVAGYASSSAYRVSVGLWAYANLETHYTYSCHAYASAHWDMPMIANLEAVRQSRMQGYAYSANIC